MHELDELWSQKIAAAISSARASGRSDIADYLELKQSNDLIRQTSVDWLFSSVIELASDASRTNPHIKIEREEPHEFDFRSARMAGSLVRVRFGVRSMTAEAGWPRTPAHGFMRGQALAAARILHFGVPKADVELMLMREGDQPVWKPVGGDVFGLESLHRHLAILLEN
jgi:hypothetical protein